MDIYSQIRKNNLHTWLVLTAFIALVLSIGTGLDYFYGGGLGMPFYTLISLAVGLGSSAGSYFFGDKIVLSSTRAREADPDDLKEKQWMNVIEEMSIAAGIPMPKIYVIDDPDPNAFATGRDPQHSSIAITRGLLETLNREELQAVAAHEMSHIKNLDIRLMLVVAVLVGSVALLADWARRSMFWGRRGRSSREDNRGGGAVILLIVWLAAVILAPILSRIIAMCVSRRREYLADATGAELTRNPLALASALEKIEAHIHPTAAIHQGTAHLCIADPKGSLLDNREDWFADLFSTHPPAHKRIEALRQMAYVKTGG